MRRLTTLTVLLLAGLWLGGAAAAAQTQFGFTGAGFGHAVGLAQYGAHGFAREGWTYDRILAHYYPGTTLGPAPARTIRVLLAERANALELSSAAPVRVRDAAGAVVELPAGVYRLDAGLALDAGDGPRQLVPPLRVRPRGSPLLLAGRAYRGQLVVHRRGSTLAAVNHLGLEQYLRGVVAGEMPSDWHEEALKAQAVAARSYALVSRRTRGTFDVFADTRSQVYGGVGAERARTNAAVAATRGQVVLHEGEVAWTFFSASSGGRTAAIEDVWPDAEPRPYLVSVEDPHDDLSPYHRWGPITFTVRELRAKLGDRLPAGLTELRVTRNGSGRVASVTAVGRSGTTEISGWDMRILLGLRSTWFEIETVGSLAASPREVVYGEKVELSAVVPGPRRVVVEHRRRGRPWRPLRTLRPGDAGRVALAVRPKATSWFRLRTASRRTSPVRVTVARAVSLEGELGAGALSGRVRPALPGAAVTIERLASGTWIEVASARAGARGRFRAALDLMPGVYRARVPSRGGLAAGTSLELELVRS